MKLFDVKSCQMAVTAETAFSYIANPNNLSEWTNAFNNVEFKTPTALEGKASGKSQMLTPEGSVTIDLTVETSQALGIINWHMAFPDGSHASAYSRIIALSKTACAYSFVLTPPPAILEALEGSLEQQLDILENELLTLKNRLEND